MLQSRYELLENKKKIIMIMGDLEGAGQSTSPQAASLSNVLLGLNLLPRYLNKIILYALAYYAACPKYTVYLYHSCKEVKGHNSG